MLPTNSRTFASSEQQSSSQEFAVRHDARPTTVPDGTRHAMAPVNRRRLPIGIQTFREIREEGCYYVDKTAYIRRLFDEGKHYSRHGGALPSLIRRKVWMPMGSLRRVMGAP